MRKQKNKDEIIESALAGGLIGAALGAMLTGKSKDSLVAALLGAAIGASVKALDEAKVNGLPVLIEENGALYKLNPDGTKKLLKRKKKVSQIIPPSFQIE
jgi:uncharacterized membrane protein